MRNMKPSSSLKILYIAAFHFKEEGVLAAHPPSCHPWRVFGYLENERKGKRRERQKLLAKKKLLLIEKIALLQCLSGAFIAKPPLQNTKKTKKKAIAKDKYGRNKKM